MKIKRLIVLVLSVSILIVCIILSSKIIFRFDQIKQGDNEYLLKTNIITGNSYILDTKTLTWINKAQLIEGQINDLENQLNDLESKLIEYENLKNMPYSEQQRKLSDWDKLVIKRLNLTIEQHINIEIENTKNSINDLRDKIKALK